jgi:hypothetical protein
MDRIYLNFRFGDIGINAGYLAHVVDFGGPQLGGTFAPVRSIIQMAVGSKLIFILKFKPDN